MLEQLIPEYLAQNMKEIGFDEPCWGVWLNGRFEPRYKSRNSKYKPNQKLDKREQRYCTAPTWDQVFEWFRERGFYKDEISYTYTPEDYYVFHVRSVLDRKGTQVKELCYKQVREKILEWCCDIYIIL